MLIHLNSDFLKVQQYQGDWMIVILRFVSFNQTCSMHPLFNKNEKSISSIINSTFFLKKYYNYICEKSIFPLKSSNKEKPWGKHWKPLKLKDQIQNN
jgi:hypothetical protein